MKIDWLRVKWKVRAVFNPLCWMRNHRTDLAWDKELWDLLVRGDILYVGNFEAIIGDHAVWIENHPYASGRIRVDKSCSRATALFMRSQLPEARIMQVLAGRVPDKWGIFHYKDLMIM